MQNKFTIEEVREFWDDVAEKYEPSNEKVGYIHYQRYEKALEELSLEPGDNVLNIWSRMGSLIPYLRKGPEFTLTNREVSPKFMAVAKERYPDENFGLTDLEDLSEFPDNSFDKIVSLELLEHTPKPLVFLKEINRILKPGGTYVTSLPPRGFEPVLILWEMFMENHGEGPHLFLWPYQVKRLMKDTGFELVSHDPTIILPLGSDKRERASEKWMNKLFSWTPLPNFLGVRHFYTARKPE